MRLIVLLLFAVISGAARGSLVPSWSGVWVSGSPVCSFGVADCGHLILNIARNPNELKIIEIAKDEDGVSVHERLYSLGGQVLGIGSARTKGKRATLRYSNQSERWTISKDGSRLTVDRWSGLKPKLSRQVLVFHRSTTTLE